MLEKSLHPQKCNVVVFGQVVLIFFENATKPPVIVNRERYTQMNEILLLNLTNWSKLRHNSIKKKSNNKNRNI